METQSEGMVRKLNTLENEWGQELTLVDEEGVNQDSRYRILRELEVDGRHYAVLSASEERDPDAFIFRVSQKDGGPRLEHVDDEDEWDHVTDALDEMLYLGD
ncbi:DUF1292 domain-containing protein [Kroppenstedtia eburnea]|nr:DUF1292 domain-containing protein [Kroppenstedtia eburnea]QKI82896.1 DUF1292 domain-containing protein [Kroppenstedtia eburnea]